MECAPRSQTWHPRGMCSKVVMACPKRRSSTVQRRLSVPTVAYEVCLTPGAARWVATDPEARMRRREMVLQYSGGLGTRRMTMARMAPVLGRCALGIHGRKRETKEPHMLLCPASLPVGEEDW
ncbi:hypothetical protein PMIN01_13001 [Paraphaeosphaeria minitans]|uniref:Uncharacterized protein n=1 Tax=Paraphaeosphaeria minitans TaxID=565426 RepID=A0A9P6KK75_9PLEO|nr:hypothetical protein PMIN01_13001 [Paraphaeosphaeria minitans]